MANRSIVPVDALGWVTQETVETYPIVLILIVGSFAMVAVLLTTWIKVFEGRGMLLISLLFSFIAS